MERDELLPRPFPDPVLYRDTLEAGFRAFPERAENYRKFQEAARAEKVDYLPIRLDIENVSRCNYYCTMCQVSDWPGLKRADDMSFDDYRALVDSQYGLVEIKLQGMGEPLMGRCYAEMIEYARARHIWVRSSTNASLLRLKDSYRHVIDADICELQVSIDGATKETYEAIRRGGNFENVKENCALLNDYCQKVGRQRTRMWVVVQRGNIHEFELFPRLAAELGFDRLTLSLDLNDWGQEEWRTRNDRVDVHRQFDADQTRRLVDIGGQHGVAVTFWFIDEKYDTTAPGKLCPWPFERAYISSDMRIVPCCMIANPEILDVGDARRLTGEWNGDAVVNFRRLHLQGRIPRVCRSCYRGEGTAPRA
ncbi:MAG: radical SAM protein [Planctomycetes bacterium]|nr:radical SAM protein [Planctomycetota bacterium]MBI3457038.1 radical SAM protein [Candidatus Rokubacteria bacterium]